MHLVRLRGYSHALTSWHPAALSPITLDAPTLQPPCRLPLPPPLPPLPPPPQDTLLGSRLISKRDTFIDADLIMNILMCMEDWDGTVPMPTILKPKPLWTGKQVGAWGWRVGVRGGAFGLAPVGGRGR